jgi:hypothetical protein
LDRLAAAFARPVLGVDQFQQSIRIYPGISKGRDIFFGAAIRSGLDSAIQFGAGFT